MGFSRHQRKRFGQQSITNETQVGLPGNKDSNLSLIYEKTYRPYLNKMDEAHFVTKWVIVFVSGLIVVLKIKIKK